MFILIVEDDQNIAELIEIHLKLNNFEVEIASNGIEGQLCIEERDYDLIILDLMMPIMNGFELLPLIKKKNMPVIILSAKDQLEDKIKGFHLGADDYLTKPFEAVELIMRVKAILNRTHKKIEGYHKHGIALDFSNRVIKKSNKSIDLTLKEYDLLLYLIKNEGIALSRDKLLEEVWDYSFMGESRTVDIHVQKLRKKLELPIETIYKYGYRLEV